MNILRRLRAALKSTARRAEAGEATALATCLQAREERDEAWQSYVQARDHAANLRQIHQEENEKISAERIQAQREELAAKQRLEASRR